MTTLTYSVVLMCYNQADYVTDAVQALLAQDCEPVEILLSDDYSSDDTFARLEQAVAGYDGPHHVVLNRNTHNLGVNAHILRCYDLSQGDVIIATSGDDICLPNRIARTIEVFEREKPLLAFSQARVETLQGQDMPRAYQKATFYRNRSAQAASTSMQLYLGATCAWHKDLFRKYGSIQSKDCFEDLIFGFRAALEERVAFIDEDLVRYRLGAGLTNTQRQSETEEQFTSRRLLELRREVAVLQQRQADATVFGLPADDPIQKGMRRMMGDRNMRQAYISAGPLALARVGWRRPLKALGLWISEAKRRRKAVSG
ncbi:glycosyltransferase [Phaeobacter sp.]|uniref:glycosyltransferase family 2 protein n=1 Tax=Phaeobacter sp. TaxID=1902409 RepID=UPI00260018D3|nr:glycosyltransferase [Phaeobacter sp.]